MQVSVNSSGPGGIVGLVIAVLMLVTMWKVFTKAGQPDSAVLIPIYNAYVLFKVAGKPGWWLILMFVPLVNIVIWIIALVVIAKNFGKGGGFALGMIFLPFIFYPVLAFGDTHYLGATQ